MSLAASSDSSPPRRLRASARRVFRDTFEPHREWTVLRDAPDLELETGDKLLEVGPGSRDILRLAERTKKALWHGNRFQARREEEGEDDDVLDDFEDWQAISFLFDGALPPWPVEGVAMQEIRAALLEARTLGSTVLAAVAEVTAKMIEHMAKKCPDAESTTEPDSPLLRQYSLIISDWKRGTILYAERAIPSTIIRGGDFLRYEKYLAKKPPEVVGGAVTLRVPRSQLQIVDDHFGNVQVLRVPFSPGFSTWESNLAPTGRASVVHSDRTGRTTHPRSSSFAR